MSDTTRQDAPSSPHAEPSGCLPTIVRLIWLAAGNAFLVIVAGLIVQKGTFSVMDILFWVIVGALVLIRYFDITKLEGLTAESEPANLGHWRRYSALLLLISAAIWAVAHAIRHMTG